MRDLSLHLLDLAQNSITAGASLVTIRITVDEAGMLTMVLEDNGKGMSPELLARVKALLRRYYVYKGKEESAGGVIAIRELTIDPDSMAVTLAGRPIQLTDIEFRLLSTMAQNRKKVFSAQELYEQIWNEPYFYACNNTVMVHIRNLRRKIEPDPDNPQYVKTVWGKGYRVD